MLTAQESRVGTLEKRRHEADHGPRPGIFVREGLFFVKNITTDEEKIGAFKLRHRIFAKELRWVPESETQMEIDQYDKDAVFFGVYDDFDRLVAFLRLILPDNRFMMEKEFQFLVDPDHLIRKARDTGEVSRLCALPEARDLGGNGNFGVYGMTMLLYKGLYLWSLQNGLRYLYLVVDHAVFRMFKAKGFVCEPIGQEVRMADGCVAVATMIDLRQFESLNSNKRPRLMQWFSQY
jgi:acyl homoserine lactone synthase